MTASRDELHELIDELPDDQVPAAVADIRRRLPKPLSDRPWPPDWFGMIDDPAVPADLSENLDEHMEGFGASSL